MSRAPDVMKRVSLTNLRDLFDLIIDGAPQAALTADLLSSQAKTYGASFPGLHIVGMSLNTAKTVANHWLEGGFQELEGKRLGALKALTTAAPSRKPTRREAQQERIRELEVTCEVLRGDLTHLSGALKFALDCLRSCAESVDDPRLRAQLRANEKELFARAAMAHESPLPSAPILHAVPSGGRNA